MKTMTSLIVLAFSLLAHAGDDCRTKQYEAAHKAAVKYANNATYVIAMDYQNGAQFDRKSTNIITFRVGYPGVRSYLEYGVTVKHNKKNTNCSVKEVELLSSGDLE